MSITLIEAVTALRNGELLKWESSGSFKAGQIILDTAWARRVFDHLISIDPQLIAATDETLFPDIVKAWEDEETDPAGGAQPVDSSSTAGPWRLSRIEATGFGGLNTPGGPAFELDVGGENWCLEGYNGSGKTSLSSLILWTMTGYRNREQDGPYRDEGRREPVTNASGKKIGAWPPLITYPSTADGLKKAAVVESTLTFVDPNGTTALAYRKISCPVEGDPVVETNIAPVLLASPELIETGLLMPARIGHIGFGDRSQSLYQALKMLTGLDQLAAVALGVSNIAHRSKRFLKYAKDNGADALEVAFNTSIEQVRVLAEGTSIALDDKYKLGSDDLIDRLSALEKDASGKAGAALAVLKTEIAPNLDLENANDRNRLNTGVSKARVHIEEGTKGLPLFTALGALKKAHKDGFSEVETLIDESKASLAKALKWHSNQQSDHRLRLKALAAKFFVPVEDITVAASCPLCDTELTSEAQKALAEELATLKQDADAAERGIVDACSDIENALNAHIPDYLRPAFSAVASMAPRADFAKAIKARFADEPPYSDVLTGIAGFTENVAQDAEVSLPTFTHTPVSFAASDIAEVKQLHKRLSDLERVAALATWWSENSSAFGATWNGLIGQTDDEGNWPADSLEGKIETLEDAISGSEPLDKIAKLAAKAKTSAEDWQKINDVQIVREAIAEAVKPLKDLQHLVDCETHRAIETLSGRVGKILEDIRLEDRFAFENAAMSKKSVSVQGSFAPGLKIDAAFVANSSWLRALLWAFIFALREQTIADTGANGFPLMVLDDPQTTFDPKNKRKWASKIVDLANRDVADSDGMQLFLATHERQFYDVICQTCSLVGQQGKMARPTQSSRVAHIVNGTFLKRQFEKAAKDQDDEEGYRYVQQVRIYCEDLLKIMLRPESYEIHGETLGNLCKLLSSLRGQHIAPFNRGVFQTLTNSLNEETVAIMKVINATHHTYDGTIGYAQAVDVKAYWDKTLEKAFVNAFRLAADYDAYGSVTRLVDWRENVIPFPTGHKEEVKALDFATTGIAAAAESDGLIVGDGQISIQEWDDTQPITLFNHSAYRLNAGTLDPVAVIGDVILVQNFGTPGPRNLVVGVYGDKLYARRLNETEDHTEIVTLTGQATDPYSLPEPVIAPKDKIELNKIVGTVFLSDTTPAHADGNEVSKIDIFQPVQDRLTGIKLLQVKGRSMEPIALEGQYVMTRDETVDLTSIQKLNGHLVIAFSDSGGIFFKRLRHHGELVVLESANASASTSSEILSLADGSPYPKLIGLRSVVGVLFDPPPSN